MKIFTISREASRVRRGLRLPSFVAINLVFAALCHLRADPERFSEITEKAQIANRTSEPILSEPFKPSWESFSQYAFPEWFRDAKFGIWAHWGPQCQPEMGDWYAKNMYTPLDRQGRPNSVYQYHLQHYGHPSEFGFKDIIPLWTAERWDPESLVALYKRCGARYFMAMANHHDNFDMWDSKYQPWNAMNIGPKRDIIAGWAHAAKEQGLPFGVSVHAARARGWLGVTKGSDKVGSKAGVPYDGLTPSSAGKGKWWDGLDPQDLYAQQITPAAYNQKFYNRTVDLINRYDVDLIYFDDDYTDSGLPLYRDDSSIGLRLVAHFYNKNAERHRGVNQGLIAAKKITPARRKSLLFDIERGGADEILPEPWQTDTCLGQWHYSKPLADRDGYKSAPETIRMLVDVVSKNGNLMLNVPVRGDGTIDDHEVRILRQIGEWLTLNGSAIYSTRPWKRFGEGPAVNAVAEDSHTRAEGEKKATPLGSEDIRFTVSKDNRTLYAIVLGWPTTRKITIKSLAARSPLYPQEIKSIRLLGYPSPLETTRTAKALTILLPTTKPEGVLAEACVFEIREE